MSSERSVSATWEIRVGDCRELLRELPDGSVRCCVTSPPYWGLRDYGADGQIGLEGSPTDYIAELVETFREVRRVLADDGTLWLNLGDSYAGSWGAQSRGENSQLAARSVSRAQILAHPKRVKTDSIPVGATFKAKDLLMIPASVALALRADGWWLRSEVVWSKPNPMPESVTDRPTQAHEKLFLLAKSRHYHYDAEAIAEPAEYEGPNGRQLSPYAQGFARRTPEQEQERRARKNRSVRPGVDTNGGAQGNGFMEWNPTVRNKRNVWEIPTRPYPEAHFATFPPKLVEPCVLAGSEEGDTILDPFAGAATTGLVALQHGRSFVGLELNPKYVELGKRRLAGVTSPLPGLAA